MPLEAVITCIGESLREDLVNGLEELDSDVRAIAVHLLDALPHCSDGEPIGLRFQDTPEQEKRTRTRRRKRQITAYNQHMSDCLKNGGTFASCVQEWRDKKARGGRNHGTA